MPKAKLKKTEIPFGIPDAIVDSERITLNDQVQELYLSNTMSPEEARLFEAKQGVWSGEISHPRAANYKTDDPKRINALKRLGLIMLTHKRHTQYGDLSEKLAAEKKSKEKLFTMLTESQQLSYELSGEFWEQSPTRKFRYLVRKNRPTLAFRIRQVTGLFGDSVDIFKIGVFEPIEQLRVICALCIHPIGYYTMTYAGLLTPTDDVINVVQLIRQDERRLWKQAILHKVTESISGI